MPRSKTPHSSAPADARAGDRAFGARKGGSAPLTHERIAADMEAFRKAGGTIEVLGVTRTLKKVDAGADADAPTAPPVPARKRAR